MMRRLMMVWMAAAVACVMLAGAPAKAESGFLFAKHKIGSLKNQTFRPKPGGWHYMPGGFWLQLEGGHIFRYRKLPNGKTQLQLNLKRRSGYFTFKVQMNPGRDGVTYELKNGRRWFRMSKTLRLNTNGANNTPVYNLWLKKGSVLIK